VESNRYWEKVGRCTLDDLPQFLARYGTLWGTRVSSFAGVNDRIRTEDTRPDQGSLKLIRVPDLVLRVTQSQTSNGLRRSVQGDFGFSGQRYRLRVTDPDVERAYFRLEVGEYHVGERFLTISLGEPFEGYCYKLIAAVIGEE